jgi:hypothetical protein
MKEERTSFLKKSSKKLLQMRPVYVSKGADLGMPLTDKSFLVLFFKKELLPSFLCA